MSPVERTRLLVLIGAIAIGLVAERSAASEAPCPQTALTAQTDRV